MSTEELLSRCLKLLQGAIRASGHTQTEVDGLIQRRRGFLSHVFQRRVDLKLIDLLRALDVLGIEPRQFFRAVVTSSGSGGEDLVRMLADRLGRQEDSGAAGAGRDEPPVDPVLEAQVRRAVRAILAEGSLSGFEGPRN